MGKRKKRCRVLSCKQVIKPEFELCYMHRNWRDKLAPLELKPAPALPLPIRFFCDVCGTSSPCTHCRQCGHKCDEID